MIEWDRKEERNGMQCMKRYVRTKQEEVSVKLSSTSE